MIPEEMAVCLDLCVRGSWLQDLQDGQFVHRWNSVAVQLRGISSRWPWLLRAKPRIRASKCLFWESILSSKRSFNSWKSLFPMNICSFWEFARAATVADPLFWEANLTRQFSRGSLGLPARAVLKLANRALFCSMTVRGFFVVCRGLSIRCNACRQ